MEFERVGHSGHLSDGVLEMGDQRIAIEVELTTKGKHRLKNIILQYAKNFRFKEVWYFCGNKKVVNLVKSQAASHKFIKVFLLDEWIKSA